MTTIMESLDPGPAAALSSSTAWTFASWPMPTSSPVAACSSPALESWSAWSFAESGLEPPAWQVEICDRARVFLGRADAWWRQRVAGESDGRLKYRLRALERGGIGADSLAAVIDEERRRESGLRRAGARRAVEARDVLRPTWATALARHIRAQLALADRLEQLSGRVLDV